MEGGKAAIFRQIQITARMDYKINFNLAYLHKDVVREHHHNEVIDHQQRLEVKRRPVRHDLWTQVAHCDVGQTEGDGGPGGIHEQPRPHTIICMEHIIAT